MNQHNLMAIRNFLCFGDLVANFHEFILSNLYIFMISSYAQWWLCTVLHDTQCTKKKRRKNLFSHQSIGFPQEYLHFPWIICILSQSIALFQKTFVCSQKYCIDPKNFAFSHKIFALVCKNIAFYKLIFALSHKTFPFSLKSIAFPKKLCVRKNTEFSQETLCSLRKALRSTKKLCVLSQKYCVPQNTKYYFFTKVLRSLTKHLHSLIKILRFPRNFAFTSKSTEMFYIILFPSQMLCKQMQSFSGGMQ